MQPSGETAALNDWYIAANRNGATLKIIGEITLGEAADGELAFNSRDRSERWITLAVQDAHTLAVTKVDAGYLLRESVRGQVLSAGATIRSGTGLHLPNNLLCVSHTLQPGGIEHRFTLHPRRVTTRRAAPRASGDLPEQSMSNRPAKSSRTRKPPAKTRAGQAAETDECIPLLDDIVIEVDSEFSAEPKPNLPPAQDRTQAKSQRSTKSIRIPDGGPRADRSAGIHAAEANPVKTASKSQRAPKAVKATKAAKAVDRQVEGSDHPVRSRRWLIVVVLMLGAVVLGWLRIVYNL